MSVLMQLTRFSITALPSAATAVPMPYEINKTEHIARAVIANVKKVLMLSSPNPSIRIL
ncbi:MAG: hypothetical protein OSB69_21695 [Alphaproteobacteria bacterium]|nr:hypothetical protein [Alphaproteobacteria bacterium]